MWHAATKKAIQDGKVAVVAIVEEQHPDRARLFLQWKQVDWPVLADSLDLLDLETVPLTVAVDEYGVVRFSELPMAAAATIEQTFVNQTYAKPSRPEPVENPDLSALRSEASTENTLEAWRVYGDALSVYGAEARWSEVIDAYRHAAELAPDDGPTQFRLGSALRRRYDSPARGPRDFQEAGQHWMKALDIDPNRYIWRRRLQQYGPRLEAPVAFFDWIRDARAEIAGRGEVPLALTVEPGDSEVAVPDPRALSRKASTAEPDASGRIRRDRGEFIEVETATVPPVAAPGETVRVHVRFQPNLLTKAHWNNEIDPLVYWVHPPAGWTVDPQALIAPSAATKVSQEPRTMEFEVRVPATEPPGTVSIPGYALYYACEDVDGVCVYRRRDVTVALEVTSKRAGAKP